MPETKFHEWTVSLDGGKKYVDWDNVVKPVLLDTLKVLELTSWETSYYGTRKDAQLKVKVKRNIRKLLSAMEDESNE